jgi:hypothetical protein
MRLAAEFWAERRLAHKRAAPDNELDADMILAAQARCHQERTGSVIVVTTNVKHLVELVDAQEWSHI